MGKKANEHYLVQFGEYADRSFIATTATFKQAEEIRDQHNAGLPYHSDLKAEIVPIRHYKSGQRVT